jgi:hypothetical protein
MFRFATVLVLSAAAVASGCGGSSSPSSSSGQAPNPNTPEKSPSGDIPDNQAYVAYKPPGAGYSVKVPEGWAQRTSGGVVTFTDKLNSVRLEAPRATPALTAAGARGKVTRVKRTAGTGVRIAYLANSATDPVTGKRRVDAVERYVFLHHGRAAVLTLSGPKGADNVDPWRIVTDSLRWTR